jgi:hypothetical protein
MQTIRVETGKYERGRFEFLLQKTTFFRMKLKKGFRYFCVADFPN